MKATLTLRKNLGNARERLNPYISQARQRERFWFDFRIEFELIGARLHRLHLQRLSELYGTSSLEILSVIPDGLFEDLAQ